MKKVLVTLLGLFGAPAVIQHPHSELAPGEYCRTHPPLIAPLSSRRYRFLQHELRVQINSSKKLSWCYVCHMYNKKGSFQGERCSNGPCLGRTGNFIEKIQIFFQ